MEAYVWVIESKRKVLLTDDPGPPIGGRFIGAFPLPDLGWGEAHNVSDELAKKYGFEVAVEPVGPSPDEINDTAGAEEWQDDCDADME